MKWHLRSEIKALRRENMRRKAAAKAAFFMPSKEATMEKQYKANGKASVEVVQDGGVVKGYASTFDRVPDAYGDVIARGAFAKSLERWAALNAEGKFIPLLWGHDTGDPLSNIGRVVKAQEDERGLYIEAEFDADNERAQYVRKLIQEGRVYQFSFAFEVRDQGPVELEDGTKANELREVELFEVSVVQIPANQHATVEDVKSIKSGRRNSAKDADDLRRIAALASEIQEVVDGLLLEASEDEQPADVEDEREGEQPEGAKSQDGFVAAYRQAINDLLGD